MFRIVGRADALAAAAASMASWPTVCEATFREGRSFELEEVYHPLVEGAVANSLRCDGESILLSGTNMSGKTTFIKTLGINLILAQTLGFCVARRASAPRATVRSLIDRQDTILSRQSYFFAEANDLLAMARERDGTGREFWFVLDEIFRGTNAVERIAAGAAVLTYLHSLGFVIASTHDREVYRLLGNEFESFHFAEVVDGDAARFDYRLKKGLCTTRNAIKLLTLAGFPKNVTDLAEVFSKEAEGGA
jgi:DNA mismatch repair ATPase MutS